MSCCPNCGYEPPKRRQGTRKLTDSDVIAIRADTRTMREIAFEYGVSQVSVWKVKHRNSYYWVEAA